MLSCAVCLGSQIPDVQTGYEFREEMYEHLNTTLPTSPPRRVLFYLRQGLENRQLKYVDQLEAIVSKFDINYT